MPSHNVGGDITNRHLTTDPEPDPAMYQMTVADAIAANKPLVVVLATPGFCVTRTCGPMVDVVKSVRSEFADRANFIHIEIADLDATAARGEVVYNSFYKEWNHLRASLRHGAQHRSQRSAFKTAYESVRGGCRVPSRGFWFCRGLGEEVHRQMQIC